MVPATWATISEPASIQLARVRPALNVITIIFPRRGPFPPTRPPPANPGTLQTQCLEEEHKVHRNLMLSSSTSQRLFQLNQRLHVRVFPQGLEGDRFYRWERSPAVSSISIQLLQNSFGSPDSTLGDGIVGIGNNPLEAICFIKIGGIFYHRRGELVQSHGRVLEKFYHERQRYGTTRGRTLTGEMFASPVIAPCARTASDGTMKSVYPPNTRKGASAVAKLLGNSAAKEGSETVAQILVSFPTFPHLIYRRG